MGAWSCLFVLLVCLKLPEIEYLDYNKFLLRTRGIYDLLDPEVVLALEIVVATVVLSCCFMVLAVYIYYIRKVRKARGSPLQNSTQNKSMLLSPVKNNNEDIGKLETSISDLFPEEGQDLPGTEDLRCTTADNSTPASKMSVQLFLKTENITYNFAKSDGHGQSSLRLSKKYNLCNYYKRHKSVRLPFRSKIKVYTISICKFSHKVPAPVYRIQVLNDILLEGGCVEISAQHISVHGFEEENHSPEERSANTKAMLEMPLPDCSDDEIPLRLPSRIRRRKRAV